jgi:hypothetical protein
LNRWKPAHTQIIFDYSALQNQAIWNADGTSTANFAALGQFILGSSKMGDPYTPLG